MHERQIDAIAVLGNTDTSTDLAYLSGGVKLEGALYLHRRDAEPVLFASVIERELAASTGYRVRMWSDYDLIEYTKRHDNDRFAATVARLTDLMRDEGVSGRVAFYGAADIGYSYILLKALVAANPHLEIVGETYPSLFHSARETKDKAELAAMAAVGQQTGEVVDSVIALIQAQTVRDGMVVGQDGRPFTVGDVKAHIRLELARRNLDEAHENIFCPGRDGAIGHNTGRYDMPLRLGESIVFDIFPRDRATGYFHDLTRTFFLGYAPEPLAQRWQQVKTVFDLALERMKVGTPCRDYQDLTCDFFEDLGYPTTRSDPKTQRGYTHSLGHGVGLDIHEPPSLNLMPDNTTLLQPGHVVSVEPGVYDADEGWGIRIEDTIAFDEDGKLINLSNYRYEMVIPMG